MANDRCACGRPKYPDADCCRACWDKGKPYDDGRPGQGYPQVPDKTRCVCGKGKYPDADCCQDCWEKNSGWDD